MSNNKITGVGNPTAGSQEVATANYVDNKFIPLNGGTMSGALVLSANPSVALGAATKQYVDSAVSGAGSGSSISTSGGYSVVTSLSDIQHKKNGNTFLTETQANSFYEQDLANGVTIRNFGLYDNSSINYTHARYLINNSNVRPRFQISDVGSENTQCNRLSSWRWDGNSETNELYINFKPA